MERINIKNVLFEFEKAAINHSKATEEGNYKVCNENYLIIIKNVKLLNKHNALKELSIFLKHDCINVRLWSATYLLNILEIEGLKVLKEIASSEDGLHSFNAEITINEWEKGNLKL